MNSKYLIFFLLSFITYKIVVAQRKRVGLITQKSLDRNKATIFKFIINFNNNKLRKLDNISNYNNQYKHK